MFALSLLLVASAAEAQSLPDGPAVHDPQVWGLVTATGAVGGDFRLYGEVQPRFDLKTGAVERVLLRAAIGVQLSEPVSLWLGFGWTPLLSPKFASEERPFLQLQVNEGIGPVRIVSRTRLELRLIAGAGDPSIRLRSMFRGVLPLGESGFGLAAYDELFGNLNSATPGPQAGLDQNRLFAGLNYRLSSAALLEGGYLFNYVWRTSNDRVIHALVLQLAFNF